MSVQRAPGRPWQPEQSRQIVRGRLRVRLRPGVFFEDLPSRAAVRTGRAVPSARIDGGAVDRTLRRHSSGLAATYAYAAAGGYGARGVAWDEVERAHGLARSIRVSVDPDTSLLRLCEALRQLDAVEEVSPDFLCQTPFSYGAHRAALPGDAGVFDQVGAGQALAMEPGDPTLIVGVVDSGVVLDHPELAQALRAGADTVDLEGDLLSRGLRLMGDTRGRDRDPTDEMGHGTACASILVARGDRVHPGLAGAARLLPVRALARAQRVDATRPTAVGAIPDIDEAVKLAVDLGARVINLSFGTPSTALRSTDPVPHRDVVAYAAQRGCVLVAASGNSGDDAIYYPAGLPQVIAVGSVDERRRPSSFSCRGPHVAVSAPGEDIPAAGLDGYQTTTGTSFAAPFVAGAAALLLARAARASTPLSPAEVRRLLEESAASFGPGLPPVGAGHGVLDVPGALRLLDRSLNAAAYPSIPLASNTPPPVAASA